MPELFFISFVLLCFSGTSVSAQLKVSIALCENKINPTGIDWRTLHFGWEMSSSENGKYQTGYQLAISSSFQKSESEIFDVYNSGYVKGNQNVQVAYHGGALASSKNYYWKVRVWDNEKNRSEWSKIHQFTTGLLAKEDWCNAKWIAFENYPKSANAGTNIEIPWKKSGNRYLVSPLFRKEFIVKKELAEALLFVTGLGQYEGTINGKKITNSFLTPGWTDYDKTVLYNTYNVTDYLSNGRNVLGFKLGNGFYNTFRERYSKISGNGFGALKMISRLKLTYQDGNQEDIVSDDSWKSSCSPITFNNIYGGEDYDARLEQQGWDTNSFNDASWKQALYTDAPIGKLVAEKDFPVVFKDTLIPLKIHKITHDIHVYDFGQNASGIVQVKVKGERGHTLRIYPSELLTKSNLITQENSGTPYYYSYTLNGVGEEVFQPRFSYYGFRYVQIEGAVPDTEENPYGLPLVSGIKMLHNTNSQPESGTFTCSNELLNRIFKAILWSMKSNLQSISTDCPHREKLGWQEQNNLMGSSIQYNFNIYSLFQKIVGDLMDARHEDGLVPNVAPEFLKLRGNMLSSPEWGSSCVILPWFLYKWYGDKVTMKTAFPMMKAYMSYLENKSKDHILSIGLGDWCDMRKGKVLLTPKEVTATTTFYRNAVLMTKMADVLEYKDDSRRYRELSERIRASFNHSYFNVETCSYASGSQTSMAMPLYTGIVDSGFKEQVLQNLTDSILANNRALTGGDVGFYYLVKTLYENGKEQLLFDMNNRDDVPGYGYQLKQGATTLTETWTGNEISRNHLMLGHLMEWFYEGIGGIAQEEHSTAYKHIKIRPQPVGDLTYAKTSFHSPSGWILTDWKKVNNSFLINIKIPVNTIATVYLPVMSNSEIYQNGNLLKSPNHNKGFGKVTINSGNYTFEVK